MTAFVPAAQPAMAANPADFRAGNIISDAAFYQGDAMSEAQIQSFLNSKVPSCSAGYTCLKDFRQSTASRAADAMCSGYTGAADESAARIIAKVARSCGVSPQVIIVMLQKEQGLVASSRPSAWAWKASMGYACPDTAACDTRYYGFYNQVFMGVWQLKRYGNPPGTSKYFTWYPVGGYADVRYHPNAACGSSRVLIENKATAALYYYTPYQPNGDAMTVGYGASSNPCSSYGNRNFFYYYNDWFGTTVSPGQRAIEEKYASLGGEVGNLGQPQGAYVEQSVNGGGLVRAYANGAIAWSANRGAFVLWGDFRVYFNQNGGLAGGLGWPTSDVATIAANGGGQVQAFSGGAIVRAAGAAFHSLKEPIRGKHASTGGLAGALGWPTSDMQCTATTTCRQSFQVGRIDQSGSTARVVIPEIDAAYATVGSATLGMIVGEPSAQSAGGGGFVQAYSKGAIAWSAATGAHALTGATRTAFGASGGITGFLGWPTSASTCDASKNCTQTFQGGTIVVNAAGSASVLAGQIEALWRAQGGAKGSLGTPVGSSRWETVSGGGIVQGFTGGAVVWTSAGGAVALSGATRDAFGAAGGIGGPLGWPTSALSTLTQNGGGTVQGFQNGAITWTRASGAVLLTGEIRKAYNNRGGITGSLGWPMNSESRISANGGGSVQGFQNGAITLTKSGTSVLTGDIRAAYARLGGVTGAFGWPNGDAVAVDDGQVQPFQNGAVTNSATTGTWGISGPIRAYFNTLGGLGGTLGWPTSAQTCTSESSCSQTFQGGTIEWTASGGARLKG